MRDALGALGPVDGCNPELNNLTLAMTEVEQGDVVFLTSDGISDNFDPVVGKFAILPIGGSASSGQRSGRSEGHSRGAKNTRKPSESLRRTNSSGGGDSSELPVVEAYQRHELTLLRMEDLLRRGVSGDGPPCKSAKRLCELLLDFAVIFLTIHFLYFLIKKNIFHQKKLSRGIFHRNNVLDLSYSYIFSLF